MQLLRQQDEAARARGDEHWRKVEEKQELWHQIDQRLTTSRNQLALVQSTQSKAQASFDKELQQRSRDHSRCTQARRDLEACNRWSDPQVEKALGQEERARLRYNSMVSERTALASASTAEGRALHRAKTEVADKEATIADLERQLKAAATPPPILLHALPASQSERLVVLFFARTDMTGSMVVLFYRSCAVWHSLPCAHGQSVTSHCTQFLVSKKLSLTHGMSTTDKGIRAASTCHAMKELMQ